MIYGHADDTYRYGDKLKLNFSSNIYAWADLSGLKEHLMRCTRKHSDDNQWC